MTLTPPVARLTPNMRRLIYSDIAEVTQMLRAPLVFASMLFVFATTAYAESLIPERRLVLSRNVDFYGSDLRNIFDTSYKACARACLSDDRCKAFTFNQKSSACFPKSDVTKSEPYEGAFSARVIDASAEALTLANTRAAELDVLTPRDFAQALKEAETLADRYSANSFSARQFIDAALAERAQENPLAALRFIGAALTLTDLSDLWIQYGNDALAVASGDTGRRNQMRSIALSAFTNAYLRAETPPQQVTALDSLASALEILGRGRDAIKPLRLAQSLQSRDDIAAKLERVVGLFGFSVAETNVESNLLDPRICVRFSEELAKGTTYSDYVKAEATGLSVEASGNQICVGGLNHGERYRLTFRQGLPAASGEVLQKDTQITQYVRDRNPVVRFPGRGYVLPSSSNAAIPVVAVNSETVDLTLYRVTDRNILRTIQQNYFGKPLSGYGESQFRASVGTQIWSGQGDVETALNQDVTTRLPMRTIIGDLQPGVYALQAKIPGSDGAEAPPVTQWFVISDLGVTTMEGVDGLHVFVRALSDVSAREGIEVALLSRANEVLATTRTDPLGYARFAPGLTRGTGAAAPGLITVKADDDFAFLSLTDPEFDLSDRGVAGREPSPPIDVFLTTERGAYRAGETVSAVALARDGHGKALADLPFTAILSRPDGVEYSRALAEDQGAGGRLLSFPLASGVPRGTWTLSVYADVDAPALASTQLLVEDFLPERIDFDLSLPEGSLELSGEVLVLGVDARYLFGAPAAGLPVEGDVILRAADEIVTFPGYKFGRYDQPLGTRRGSLQGGVRTDGDGRASVQVNFPDLAEVMQPLEAEIITRVSEGSNRPVERRLTKQVLADSDLIGVKPLFDGVIGEGTSATFEVLAIAPDLSRTTMPVHWTINRVQTRYQWYSNYGNWNWNPITTRTRIAGGEVMLGVDDPLAVSAPVDWGQYELKVERTDGSYVATSVEFYAGWYASADASATPDLLEASLDQDRYKPGDTATFRIVPRYAGTALVTVMSNRLVDMKVVEVVEGENLIKLPVTDDWGSGVYVSSSVIRPMDAEANQNPARSLGLSYVSVDPGDKVLNARFDTATEVAPRGPLDVVLEVEGATEGQEVYAMIAAVDVGILNLTGFTPPSPTDHYFGQRKLGIGIRDVYGRLIDGLSGALGSVRSGGDATAQLRAQSAPPTEELVAYVSALVKVGSDGKARASFDLPEFNGTVRLMAVVWSDSAVGEATQDVLVRDPIVLTATVPRFLAPGDETQLLLEIVHATGATGEVGIDLSADGLNLSTSSVPKFNIGDLEKRVISIPIKAGKTGLASLDISLTTPSGKALQKTLAIPVQRSDPITQRRNQFKLAAGATFTLDENLFAGLAPGSASATLAAGPLARFDAPGLLATLDRYPYGCTEQVTSKALPLLYLDQVATAMGLAERENIAKRIIQAIGEVLTNQSSNGSFGLWRPDRGDLWLDAYVSDFLTRARMQGHDVPDLALRQALDNLRNQVNTAADFENGGEGLAYALLVLAREGVAAIGDLRYYADVKADAFGSALAVAQIGAALASYGDQTRADTMFRKADARLDLQSDDRGWRSDYGTDLRDAAAVLTLAVEAGSKSIDATRIASRIAPQIGDVVGRSTQESVWTLLAANALLQSGASDLTLNGAPVKGPLVQVLAQDAVTPVEIKNNGQTDTIVTLSTFGVPDIAEPAGGNGYQIERSYFTLDGQPAALDGAKSGERRVAVLTITPFNKAEARLMVNDPLPAGYEIDNPNLLRGGDIRSLEWLKLSNSVRNTEFRQDRFLAAVDHRSDKSFQLAYILRAIAPGTYHHPAASVEDMYRPSFRARTGSDQVVVLP